MGLFKLSKREIEYYENIIKDKEKQISKLELEIKNLNNNNDDKQENLEEKCTYLSKKYGNTKIGEENLNLINSYKFLKMWVGAKTYRIYGIDKNTADYLFKLLDEKEGKEHIQLKLLNIIQLSSIDIDEEVFNDYLIDKSLQRSLIKDIELGSSKDILNYLEEEAYNFIYQEEIYKAMKNRTE